MVTYNEAVLRHFESPARAGVLGAPAFRGQAGGRGQGTWVQFDLRLDAEAGNNRIADARFLAFACPHVIAAADWVATQAIGRVPARELPESVQALQERFAVPIEKLGRLLLVEDAWIAAVVASEDSRTRDES